MVVAPGLIRGEPHRSGFQLLDGGGELWIGFGLCVAWTVRRARRSRIDFWPLLAELVPFMLVAFAAYEAGCVVRSPCGPWQVPRAALAVAAAVALHRAWTIDPRTVVAMGLAGFAILQVLSSALGESQHVRATLLRCVAAATILAVAWGGGGLATRLRRLTSRLASSRGASDDSTDLPQDGASTGKGACERTTTDCRIMRIVCAQTTNPGAPYFESEQ